MLVSIIILCTISFAVGGLVTYYVMDGRYTRHFADHLEETNEVKKNAVHNARIEAYDRGKRDARSEIEEADQKRRERDLQRARQKAAKGTSRGEYTG